MPKKLNFLGGMQNYDPNNGQYEPNLVGANGEVPEKSFAAFKKENEKPKQMTYKELGESLEKEPNPMEEFSGPDSEGPSFAEIESEEIKKPQSLNDYTDYLFEKVGVKKYDSKKYKNPSGEIIEIRRFGEGKNAIKYNKTKDIVEQVWYNGEKVN